jgi:hypothetical protein
VAVAWWHGESGAPLSRSCFGAEPLLPARGRAGAAGAGAAERPELPPAPPPSAQPVLQLASAPPPSSVMVWRQRAAGEKACGAGKKRSGAPVGWRCATKKGERRGEIPRELTCAGVVPQNADDDAAIVGGGTVLFQSSFCRCMNTCRLCWSWSNVICKRTLSCNYLTVSTFKFILKILYKKFS